MRRGRLALIAAPAILLAAAGAAVGQELPLQRDPPVEELVCAPGDGRTATTPPDSATREAVEQLTRQATQALLLGDRESAAEALSRALEQDPNAAEAIYLRGRIASDTRDAAVAVEWFCRYLQLAPDGSSAPDVRTRLATLASGGDGGTAWDDFVAGIALFEVGEEAAAEQEFAAVVAARPGAASAHYNRGVIQLRTGRVEEARESFERYLALEPDSDARARVQSALLRLPTSSPRRPAVAFLLGSIVPGGGQYYTGRGAGGFVVTALAGGAVATGLLVKRTTIRCLDVTATDSCPPASILDEETERPYLAIGLAAAGVIAIAAAIEAALHAGGDDDVVVPPSRIEESARVRVEPGPSLGASALHVSLLSFRF
jgi:tetratricopeptide (TPR) repeat protein